MRRIAVFLCCLDAGPRRYCVVRRRKMADDVLHSASSSTNSRAPDGSLLCAAPDSMEFSSHLGQQSPFHDLHLCLK